MTTTTLSPISLPHRLRSIPWRDPLSSRRAWIVLALIAALFIGTCGTPVIFDDNEGLYAGAVKEMHSSGNWLIPTNNGFPRVQKPPLVYWTMLVSTSALGFNEFALRLPNALASFAWILGTYLILRRLGGESLGLAAAVILASMLGVCIFTHLIQPEPFLAAAITFSFWCLLEARWSSDWNETKSGWILGFWACLALGTLSKGLHGALWPLGTVLLTAWFLPSTRPWLQAVLCWRGLGLFLLLVLPWYFYMAIELPGFLSAHFLNEQLGASLNMRYPPDAEQLPVWQFYLQHLLFWLPWTLMLPAAIHVAITHRHSFTSPRTREASMLLVIWTAVTLISVAFSTRQDYYSMSCWGMIAAFLALPWLSDRWPRFHLPRAYFYVPALLLALGGLAALILSAWLVPRLSDLANANATAAPIGQRDTFANALAGISPGLWFHFLPMLALFGSTLLLAGLAAAWQSWHQRQYRSLLIISGAMAVPFCLAAIGFSLMGSYFSLAASAKLINREMTHEPTALVSCEALPLPHTASSLLCYLDARVHWVNTQFESQYAQRVLGEGREFYWNEAELKKQWAGANPVFLIVEETRLPYWQGQLTPPARVLLHDGSRVVVENR